MRYYSSTASEKTLSSAVNNTQTTITLNNLTGLPSSYPYTLVLDPDTSSEEIVLVTALSSGTTLTVVRGSDTSNGVAGGNGTSKQAHNSGATVKHMITARDLQEPQDHIAASTNVHGLSGGAAVVGTTSSQTLTNKTISGSSNTVSNIAQSSVTNLTTDLAAKAPLASPTFTGTVTIPAGASISGFATTANPTFTGTVVLPSTTSIGTVSSTEIGYVDGVTSAIQTQLDAKQPLDSDLTAVAGLSTTGLIARTGSGTASTRSISAGDGITVTNGDGVSGNPTIKIKNVSAYYTNAATSQTTTNLSVTAVKLDTLVTDGIGSLDGTTNSKWTATTTGYYRVRGHVAFDSQTNGSYRIALITKNGTSNPVSGSRTIQRYASNAVPSGAITVDTADCVVYLTGGSDYIELCAQNDGGNLALVTGTYSSSLSVTFLGA